MLQATQSIQLPHWLLVHAFGLCALGVRPICLVHAVPPDASQFFFMNQGTPWNNNAIRGILTFGIGAAYVAAAYMPPEDNQFLAASVPVQLAIGGIAAAAAILGKGDRTTLLAVAAYSTVCGGLVGRWLDNYSGRIALAATR
jgi:hypothetical protein